MRTVYPKIEGRLRLAHEDNDNLSITTEIIKYDENIAVVRAISTTTKGSFPGIGMSSKERDDKIAPAILELAETHLHFSHSQLNTYLIWPISVP